MIDSKVACGGQSHKKCFYSYLLPTRERPEKLMKMLKSMRDTCKSPGAIEVLIYIDSDDERRTDYQCLMNKEKEAFNDFYRVSFIFEDRVGVPRAYNRLASVSVGAFIFVGNDDLIFRTKDWDALIRISIQSISDPGTRIATLYYPNDGLNFTYSTSLYQESSAFFQGRPPHSAFPIVSREWYEALGYLFPEYFEHYFIDTWLFYIADFNRTLAPFPEILVEHMHHSVGKSAIDSTYKGKISVSTTGTTCFERDLERFTRLKALRMREARKIHLLRNGSPLIADIQWRFLVIMNLIRRLRSKTRTALRLAQIRMQQLRHS